MYQIYRKWTTTNSFIVPLLGIKREKLIFNGMENAYIKDEVKGIDYENAVYLLFRPMDQDKFADFILEERGRRASLIDEYDYPDGWTMLVYQYDRKWEEDVNKLLRGEFSLTSKEYQNMLPKTIQSRREGIVKETLTFQHQVFKKAPQLAAYWQEEFGLELDYNRDEFWGHYLEREIFTESLLKELV